RQDNLQEPMYRALMEAHARQGERPEALRQYEQLQGVLEQELGVEPLPETETLRAAILNGELGHVAVPTPSMSRSAQPSPTDGTTEVPFVGRWEELAALDAELAVAARGEARVVLLAGEVGIGKSRLWQEWSASLAPHVTVLEGAGLSATQALPFAPLMELFATHPSIQHLFKPDSPLSSVWLAEMARLLPQIRSALPQLPAPTPLSRDEEQHRLFEAFTQSLRVLEARPLLLFMDDLHWADRATLDWLAYFVHRMRDQALLLVVAYRPEDARAPLVHLFAEWGRQGISRRIELSHLAQEESSALLEALIHDPEKRSTLADRLQTQSAGNPYFLIELARAAPGDVPPALVDLIRARLERLPDAARQVLQAAAVLEPTFDFSALRWTSGRGEEETLDALDALLDAHLLVERGTQYAFTHPLVASIVQESLSTARRAFLHRRAATARERVRPEQRPQIAGSLMVHYREAGDPVRAAYYAEMAAEHALSLFAPAEAEHFYREAVALDPTPTRQLGLGRALRMQADYPAARSSFKRALAGFEAVGDRRGAVRACVEMAWSYLPVGRGDEAARWAEQALSYLDVEQDPEGHADAHFLMGAGLLQVGALAEAEEHLAKAAQLAVDHDLPNSAARSRFELGNLLAQRGRLRQAVQAYHESISLAEVTGDESQIALGHNNAAYHSILLGDLEAAREHVEIGLDLVEANDLQVPRQYLYSTRGELALAEEQWDEAEEWFQRGMAEAERQGNLSQVANYQANLALVERGRGNLDSALLLLDSAREAVQELPAPHLQVQIDLWLTEVYLQSGALAAARDALNRAGAYLASREREGLLAWAARLRKRVEREG
ncbi:MAG: AAA family ATPase, partial [Chloroflexota bacterium]|nr:AAA family ATPase [Chloroflexota bacterium]